jgi:hypothetical protein
MINEKFIKRWFPTLYLQKHHVDMSPRQIADYVSKFNSVNIQKECHRTLRNHVEDMKMAEIVNCLLESRVRQLQTASR